MNEAQKTAAKEVNQEYSPLPRPKMLALTTDDCIHLKTALEAGIYSVEEVLKNVELPGLHKKGFEDTLEAYKGLINRIK